MTRSPEFANCRVIHCELKAGSILVCDTRGIHRTSYLHSGERWHIYSTYSMEGYRRGGVDNENWLQPFDLSDLSPISDSANHGTRITKGHDRPTNLLNRLIERALRRE